MATLDTSIPLRALQSMYDPADTVQQAASLKDLMQQQQLRDLQVQEALDARQRRKSLRDLYAGAVNPQTGEIDYRKVRTGYAQMGDIEGLAQVEGMIAQMDERQRALVKENNEKLASVAMSLRNISPETRKMALLQMAPMLETLGFSREQVLNFDPTDANIDVIIGQALGVKGLLEQEHQDRTYNLDVQRFGETKKHNAFTRGIQQAELTLKQQKATQQDSALPKLPKPPPGYRYTANGDLEAIPGGPAAQKERQAAQKQQLALHRQEQKAMRLIADIDSAIKDVGFWSAGMGTGKLSEIRGTPAYNLERKLETIKANLGFEELQAMREASPTGGALGQVAVQELVALQSAVASLDPGQSPEQLRESLEKIRQHYQGWLNAVRQARIGEGGEVSEMLRKRGDLGGGAGGRAPQVQSLYDEFGLED